MIAAAISRRAFGATAFVLGAATLSSCADPNAITLRVGAGHPAGPSVYATELRDFFVPELKRRVAEETGYELTVIEGYSGSIATVSETLEAVESGMLDIGAYCVCFEPAKLFLHNFQYFVPFAPRSSVEAIRVARAVYDKHPWLEQQLVENYDQELLALNGWDDYHLGTVAPWDDIGDLNGVKIGGAGPNLPWLGYVGAVPVQSTLPDGYMAMQTGVYSGWLMFPSAYYGYKFQEPAPYYTLIGFGAMGGAIVVTMNSRSLQRLPEDVRKIVREVGHAYEQHAARALEERQARGLRDLRGSGAEVRAIAESVRADWARSLTPFPARMAEDANARGMPGSEIIRAYIEEAEQGGHRWPVVYTID